jgi:hypothetical protein
MTKRQAIKEIRDVMAGYSNHKYGMVYKIGRSWEVQTGMSKFDSEDGTVFYHNCNEITLKEVENWLYDCGW